MLSKVHWVLLSGLIALCSTSTQASNTPWQIGKFDESSREFAAGVSG
jgi:hypothetical protein